MKLTFSISVEQFDKDKYMKAVTDELRQVFIRAGQKFLLAAIPRIPVWTGFARGAFRNAEDLFGKVSADKTSGFRIRSSRGGGNKNTTFRRGYYYYPPSGGKILRTPQAGRQFATQTQDILDIEGATLAKGRTAFYFRFAVNIKYVDILDPIKWGAFKAGSEALKNYINNNINLPSPLNFTTRKTVTAG